VSKTSKEIIVKLKPHFARYDLPARLTTDNEPQFDCGEFQAPVVQKVDSAIHRINLYPVDGSIGFLDTYPLSSDLSGG